MESTADQTRALAFSLGIHALAAALLFAGMLFNKPQKPVIAGAPIEAVLVDMTLGRPAPQPPPPRPPPPKPEPPRPAPAPAQPAPPTPPPSARPDDVTDQRPAPPPVPDREALNLQAQRQEQQRIEEQRRAQQEELERQRQAQIEEIRRRREEAQRDREAQERELERLREADRAREILTQAAAPASTPPRGEDVAPDLLGQYAGLIQAVVTQNWRRPPNTPAGIRCTLRVRQIPGGEVIGVSIASPCNADPLIQQSIIEAVERASPLPYDGFEQVFQSSLNFNFRYDG